MGARAARNRQAPEEIRAARIGGPDKTGPPLSELNIAPAKLTVAISPEAGRLPALATNSDNCQKREWHAGCDSLRFLIVLARS
jgi:hypothetical protein